MVEINFLKETEEQKSGGANGGQQEKKNNLSKEVPSAPKPQSPGAAKGSSFLDSVKSFFTFKGSRGENNEERLKEKAPSAFGINLLPEELILKLKPQKKTIALVITGGVTALVVVLVYFGLVFYQSRLKGQSAKVIEEAGRVDQEIVSLRGFSQEALLAKTRVEAAKKLLNEHIYWTKFFEALGKHTISEVSYTSFSGDITGKISLNGVGQSYESVARQLVAFQKATDFIKTVEIRSASLGSSAGEERTAALLPAQGVNFTASLTLIPDIFYKTEGK